jgi:S-adenosylmethionine:tRNA ribosyltransferase-isomerase
MPSACAKGDVIDFGAGVSGTAEQRHDDGSWTLFFPGDEPVEVLLERAGRMPLPPYIAGKRPTDEEDRRDYQTMFAARMARSPRPRRRCISPTG